MPVGQEYKEVSGIGYPSFDTLSVMANPFEPVFQGLLQSANALVAAIHGVQTATQATQDAQAEHLDQGERIERLDARIEQLTKEIHQLRERLNGSL